MSPENTSTSHCKSGQYFGKYRGFVVENDDPKKTARLKLRVPSVLGQSVTPWALPCLPFGGFKDQGLFMVPEVNAQVWVEFEEGNLAYPIWTGTFWQRDSDLPSEASADDKPTSRLIKTPSGHLLHFQDKTDAEHVHLKHASGSEMLMDPDGNIALTDEAGAKIVLDAKNNEMLFEDTHGNKMTMTSSGTVVEDSNGNTIEMAAAGISVKGQKIIVDGSQVMLGGSGGEPILKGQSFLNLFMTHIHPTPAGPSGPPVPQGEPMSLSKKVMTS